MIHLHERLSEFSYGYGVTREIEQRLASRGVRATPFLPNLVHEANVGFDVAFSGPGRVVLLQFKLGQELSRFRRSQPGQAAPRLRRPFWRYNVDTSENQFLRLEEFETNGADVSYVAPRFSNWAAYEAAFLAGNILNRSLILSPSQILAGANGARAAHRVVYDSVDRFVCSEPRRIEEINSDVLVEKLSETARQGRSLEDQLSQLANRDRRTPRLSVLRQQRLRERAKRPSDADAAIVALEAWLQGAQVLFVTPTET